MKTKITPHHGFVSVETNDGRRRNFTRRFGSLTRLSLYFEATSMGKKIIKGVFP